MDLGILIAEGRYLILAVIIWVSVYGLLLVCK